MMILLIVEPVKKIVEWVDRIVDSFTLFASKARMRRLVKTTPLIDGYEHISLEYHELHRIHAKYSMCKILGHLWELDHVVAGFPYTYISKCARCFPHIRSQHTVQSYNLFAISEKEHD